MLWSIFLKSFWGDIHVFFLVSFMFVIRNRVFQFSNSFHALASVNHFDWQYIFALQEEGLASPENMEIDAALLPNFMESETYRFLCLIQLEYVIGGPKLCWAGQMGSCRYNQWILAACGVGTEHGSLVQTFISPSICTFESLSLYIYIYI